MHKLPRANKSLGQHFLISESVIEKITTDFEGQYESFIEVGPGPGSITHDLAKIDRKKVVVEKDQRFEQDLKELLGEENVIIQDALEVSWKELIENKGLNGPVWLVSNLPYNVSVPLTLNFIKTPEIKYMTLMVQKEVGEKMFPEFAGKKIQKARGSLGCLCQTFFDVKLLCKVPPGCFNPPPKVDSVVLTFERKESPALPLEIWDKYESFLRLFYKTRRKQLAKVLSERFPRKDVEELLLKMGHPVTARAETLNLEQVQLMFQTFQIK